VTGRLDREGSWLSAVRSRPALASPLREIDRRHEQVLGLAERGRLAVTTGLDRAGDDLAHIRARLLALSPAATLRRGYAIVQQADATVVLSAAQVSDGEALTVRFEADQLTVTAGQPVAGD
jgi:exodeoxyribonuclease VII large subunit